MQLAVAMETGRIFLWHRDGGQLYVDAATCPTANNFECFFEPPSNCTLWDVETSSDVTYGTDGNTAYQHGFLHTHVPASAVALWRRSGRELNEGELHYWWRTQATAFLARFNPAALAFLRQLRTNPASLLLSANRSALDASHAVPEQVSQLAHSFPFPAGTVSLHIRHGDKGSEMALVPSSAYFDAAEALVRLNPFAVRRLAFVSTEDPSAIDEVKARGDAWTWMWWDVPRINSNGVDQLAQLGLKRGELTFIWWLQLFMALECDAWVGTRGSNWNRLIDELRCVWVPKCNNAYTEMGAVLQGSEYGWRRRTR